MLSEQQQRIMGYFIEEAKDHLNTIEQGLLDLQGTIEDPEMVNEVFRAAHSVKGGAAMLGLTSIQHAAHRLEDYFKILKECPIKIDQALETLFLKVFDALQELLEQLQGPFGLTDEKSAEVMAGVEPVFQELNRLFSGIIGQSGASLPEDVDLSVISTVNTAPPKTTISAIPAPEESALQLIFQSDVPVRLREMLQLFKLEDTSDSRRQLQELCSVLGQYGDPLDLSHWCTLLDNVRRAISNPDNSYRTLAPIIIKEVKQAQELVLSGRSPEIAASESLKALLPVQEEPQVEDPFGADFADLMGSMELDENLTFSGFEGFDEPVDRGASLETGSETASDALSLDRSNDDWFTDAIGQEQSTPATTAPESSLALEPELSLDFGDGSASGSAKLEISDLGLGALDEISANLDAPIDGRTGPEVGIAELNSLADLFEGEMPDLGLTWQEEEVVGEGQTATDADHRQQDDANELSDLLFDADQSDDLVLEDLAEEDLSGLLGTGGVSPRESSTAQQDSSDLLDLIDEVATPSEELLSADLSDSHGLVDDPFGLELIDQSPVDDPLGMALGDGLPQSETEALGLDLLESAESTEQTELSPFDRSFGIEFSDDSAVVLSDDPFATNPIDDGAELSSDHSFGMDAGIDFGLDLDMDLSSDETQPLADDPFGLEHSDVNSPGEIPEDPCEMDFGVGLMGDEVQAQADDPFGLDQFDLAVSVEPNEVASSTQHPVETSVSDDLDFWGESASEPVEIATHSDTLERSNEGLDFTTSEAEADSGDAFLELELSDSSVEPDTLESIPEVTAPSSEHSEASKLSFDFGLDLEPDQANLDELSASIFGAGLEEPDALFELDEDPGSEEDSESESDFDSSLENDLNLAASPNGSIASSEQDANPLVQAEELAMMDSLVADGHDLFTQESDPFHNGEPVDVDVNALFADDFSDNVDPFAAAAPLDAESPFAEPEELSGELSANLFEETEEELLDLGDFPSIDAAQSNAAHNDAVSADSSLDSGLDFDLGEGNSTDAIESHGISADSSLDLELTVPFADESFADGALDLNSLDEDVSLFDERTNATESIADFSNSLSDFMNSSESVSEDEMDLGLDFSTSESSSEVFESDFESASDLDAEPDPVQSQSPTSGVPDLALDDHDFAGLQSLLEEDNSDSSPSFSLDFSDSLENDSIPMAAPMTTEPEASAELDFGNSDDFSELESMLGDVAPAPAQAPASPQSPDSSQPVQPQASHSETDTFDDLDALLSADAPASAPADIKPTPVAVVPDVVHASDEFGDLEDLLKDADQTLGGGSGNRGKATSASNRRSNRRGVLTDQTMRVSVKHLDNLNNLVGEMVVNRNSLEQAQERLRQFLDNLLYQVQQLSDVGQRMRDLYERSLLESSLLSTRRSYHLTPQSSSGFSTTSSESQSNHATGESFDALEMDRFTGFHTLSQEMIELIVRVRESASDIDFVVEESDQVTRNFRQITTQLQEGLTRARMVPFAQTADRLPRGVRDNALKYGKQAELLVEGRDTLIDKMIVEQLYDPMTHLVNNAVAHGVETPEERIAAGKQPTGKIVLRTFHQGNQTIISVSDDGMGIDQERVKSKAIAKGLITAAAAKEMTRMDTYDLLFHHGFSTADQIDDLKGRGVGLDVVRSNLNEIRGVISIDSTLGKGTTFTIRLPLTLSISKALCCISNRARIAFPMDGVEDMLDVPKERVQTDAQGRPCIYWRDALLPFQPLSNLLKHGRIMGRGSVYGGNQEEDIISVVVLRSAGNHLALQVDQVLGEQEIVIKQLEGPVPKPIGVAGATVLGDGRIMPIADVLELIDLSEGRIRREAGSLLWEIDDQMPTEAAFEKTEPTVLIVDDSITVRELLSMTFNKVGYRVEQARDGQEAWEKLRSGLPCDLVFCDIEMPRMDGLELLSRIQKDSSLNHLPIAMLTSRGADRHRQMAVQLGAKGYFTKPYLEEALLDAAQRMLKGEVLVVGATAPAAT